LYYVSSIKLYYYLFINLGLKVVKSIDFKEYTHGKSWCLKIFSIL